MQIVITVICSAGTSLRNAIAKHGKGSELSDFQIDVSKKQEPGRKPGWLKLRGTEGKRGVINIVWDSQANLLTARVITRGSNEPSPIVGHFVNYLLTMHSERVKTITTALVS